MKVYNVKCWVYSRPYIKIVAATSEYKVKELLQKEPIEIESIAEMEIGSATQLHTYEIV
ncbi:hypothetical protein ABEY43_07170 [Priestia megaterium]